jgi:hypothetical protein
MRVNEARALAEEWADAHAGKSSGCLGAFLHGSINEMPPDAELPATSDVDILVVVDDPPPSLQRGKFDYRGVLLEVSALAGDRVASADRVLADYPIAGSLRVPSVIADPTGHLSRLQAAVATGFDERRWVRARRGHAERNALNCIQSVFDAGDLHDQVMACVFGAGVMTHVLLVAGLRNPTVRRRYEAARNLLAEHGRADFHEDLLAILGCRHWSRSRAETHLAAVAAAYDAASAVVRPDYRFAADLTLAARPVAIEGSRELIARGSHREAVFWMAAVASRCQWVFHHHAPPEVRNAHQGAYQHLIDDLGIGSPADLQRRAEQARAFLPRVREVADAIMDATPGVHGP